MILVELNEDRYKYDIHSLVKAFYPAEDVQVLTSEEKKEKLGAEAPSSDIRIGLFEEQGRIEMEILQEDGSYGKAEEKCSTADATGSDSSTDRSSE
jgi:oxygen-independent coproporphyrinogen-3 oxidase